MIIKDGFKKDARTTKKIRKVNNAPGNFWAKLLTGNTIHGILIKRLFGAEAVGLECGEETRTVKTVS